MNEQISMIDFMDEEEAVKYRPIKSTDWKWSFKDYPKEKKQCWIHLWHVGPARDDQEDRRESHRNGGV